MAETQKKIKCGFAVTKTYEGQKDFDQDYVSIEIKKVVKKIGPGEEDFVLEDKVIENRVNIAESINAQAGDAGIQAYLKPFIQTGTDLPKVEVKDDIQDFTQFPEDLAGAADLGQKLVKTFKTLDPALRGKCKTPEEFLNSFTAEKFKAYLESKMPVKEKVTVDSTVKKDEDNKNDK